MEDFSARLDRVESTLAIQQLPVRYAVAVDSRDFDAWAGLFIEDVDCGKRGTGRAALKAYIEEACAQVYRTIHSICGHQIDFQDADHATGRVYCRAEHESGPDWVVMAICYFDAYERRDGAWYFVRRKERHWYAADQTRRPSGPDFFDLPGHPVLAPTLPGYFPTWHAFWSGPGKDTVGKVTAYPVESAAPPNARSS